MNNDIYYYKYNKYKKLYLLEKNKQEGGIATIRKWMGLNSAPVAPAPAPVAPAPAPVTQPLTAQPLTAQPVAPARTPGAAASSGAAITKNDKDFPIISKLTLKYIIEQLDNNYNIYKDDVIKLINRYKIFSKLTTTAPPNNLEQLDQKTQIKEIKIILEQFNNALKKLDRSYSFNNTVSDILTLNDK
jgi:hypothetical protein